MVFITVWHISQSNNDDTMLCTAHAYTTQSHLKTLVIALQSQRVRESETLWWRWTVLGWVAYGRKFSFNSTFKRAESIVAIFAFL